MKWNKLTTFLLAVIPTSIIIFNNGMQFYEKIFTPELNIDLIIAFIFIVGTISMYTIKNLK
ncbi:MAG: hypothetical protein KKF48_02550 [Nanoarchaeota archaeon]|nr:hypothetical protein [Nanoarchaeota archaeon]MBU1027901.1 hypothetical protein [Nanoarchaeota archaeon]